MEIMSQYVSRMHIKVSSPNVWLRFENADDAGFDLADDAGFDLADNAEEGKISYIIDCDCSFVEHELFEIVDTISKTLGKDGVIISDTTNIDVDSNNYCCFYLGEKIREVSLDIYSDEKLCTMFDDTSIEDIPGWLNYGGFSLSAKEKEQLFRCGYVETEDGFKEFCTTLSIPDRVYLRETGFENRAERIEFLKIGDSVTFKTSWDKYDTNRLEVFSALGSIGYLPSDISDQLTPLLSKNNLVCSGTVVEILPISQRNQLARSCFVAVSIEASLQRKNSTKMSAAVKKDSTVRSSRAAGMPYTSASLAGRTFVVTGDLFNYESRDELREIIERNGGKLAGSVSSKTTALITNFPDSGTTKIKKAFECGIEIISEDEFIKRFISIQQPEINALNSVIDAKDINKNKKYEEAKVLMKKPSSADVKKARAAFSSLGEYLDSAKYLVECDALISELEIKEEAEAEKARKREAAAKKAAFEAQPNQKRKKAVKEGDKKIADFKAVVEAEAKKRIEEISKAKNAIIEAKIEEANQKSSEKQSLGFFAFGKKSNLTCEINALNNEIATLRQQLESEKQSISEKAKSAKSQYTRAINQYIEKRFIPDYGCNDSDIKLAKEIIKAIEGADGEGATLSYVLRYKDIFRDNSINKISRIMDALVDKGFLNKTTKNRVSYFRVASKIESFDWKENPNLANTPLPEPPSIDSIFS